MGDQELQHASARERQSLSVAARFFMRQIIRKSKAGEFGVLTPDEARALDVLDEAAAVAEAGANADASERASIAIAARAARARAKAQAKAQAQRQRPGDGDDEEVHGERAAGNTCN
jgi:hypothetical protein